jgi:hypothetical protein
MANSDTFNISRDEQAALGMAMEFYIRMGLGQVSEIAQRLNLLYGDRLTPEKQSRITQLCEEIEDVLWEDGVPWKLEDEETSIYMLTAFLLECKLNGNFKGAKYAEKRIAELKKKGQKIQ